MLRHMKVAFLAGTFPYLPRTHVIPRHASYLNVRSIVKIMRFFLVFVLSFLPLCRGQYGNVGNDRGLLHRRPLHHHHHHQQQSVPCSSVGYGDYYDSVEEDAEGRKLFLAAGAAVGGAALGYHLGMKHKTPVIINNNIHNSFPSPCVVSSGSSGSGGGGIAGGILSHHPILSNILQGGLWNGGGSAAAAGNRLPVNRQSNDINWNRAIRQFSRAVRPITRGFK